MIRRLTLGVVIFICLLALTGTPGWGEEGRESLGLRNLETVDGLIQAVNADLGTPRVVLLLSPT